MCVPCVEHSFLFLKVLLPLKKQALAKFILLHKVLMFLQ